MPQLIVNIPTPEAAQRIVDAVTALDGYTGEDTPQAKVEFVRQRLIAWLRGKVREHEGRLAEQQARGQPEPGIE